MLRPEHYPRPPQFLWGHNIRLQEWVANPKPRPPREPCECGCGELANYGRRFISGHNGRGGEHSAETRAKMSAAATGEKNHRFGVRPHNYKGRTYTKPGYVLLHVPAHPFAAVNGKVFEHRLVLERHLRKADPASGYLVEVDGEMYLRQEVEVHHVNGVKDDNRVENLRPMTKSEHTLHHLQERRFNH